jgi:hypothetical protein
MRKALRIEVEICVTAMNDGRVCDIEIEGRECRFDGGKTEETELLKAARTLATSLIWTGLSP